MAQGDEIRVLTGSCLCGEATYQVEDAFEYALNCHCSRCRRTTGSAFKPFGGIARDRLRFTAEPALQRRYGSEVGHDLHCARCGSLLYSVVRDGRYVHVAYGTLHAAPSRRPTAHIFVGSKAAWFDITDGLPQHDELP